MTKEQYLSELKKQLKSNGISDFEDILAEYDEYFVLKAKEGFTEEEVARKLSSPEDLAKEYLDAEKSEIEKANNQKGLRITEISLLSIPAACVLALMWCSVIVLGGSALCFLTLGTCLITTINIAGLIPYMPYFCALLLGVASLFLAGLLVLAAIIDFMFVKQCCKSSVAFAKGFLNGQTRKRFSVFPALSKKTKYALKATAIICAICFFAAFVIGFISMCAISKSFEPWHVWNWFM